MTSKKIAVYGIFGALIFVARFLDTFLSSYLPITIAVITLTVAFTFCLLFDNFVVSIAGGLIFGLSSFIVSVIMPTFSSPVMMNPLISVVPRIIVGITIFGAYKLFSMLFKGKHRMYFIYSLSAVVGAITNTVTVLGAMALFAEADFATKIIATATSINFPLEVILVPMILPFIIINVKKSLKTINLEN